MPRRSKSIQAAARGPSTSDQSVAAPPAQVVANAFVHQFYSILHQSPQLAYRFYKESSRLGRPNPNGVMDFVTTMQAINEKILAMDYSEFKAEINTVDAQESLNGGITVLVTGFLTGKDMVKKGFTQTFLLAPQDKGYFVLNDIFRVSDQGSPMASDQLIQPIAAGSLLSAQAVGNTFVQQFNHIRKQSPERTYCFHKEGSSVGRPDHHGIMDSVSTVQNSCIPPTLVGAAAAPTCDPFHLNSNTPSTLAPTQSPVSEDEQMAMAIDASIQSAIEEGVKRLEQLQPEDSKGSSSKSTSCSCVICLDAQVEGACVPCGHMAGCMTCLNEIKRKKWGCPVCRAKIDQINSCIPPTLVGAAAAPTCDPFHLNSNTPSTLAPTQSPVSEDVQMAMAIDASIQSAIAEGVKRLEQPQPEDSKGSSSRSTSCSCVICLDAQVEGACVPCGHMAGCMTCLTEIKRKNWGCPVCRAKIDQIVRIYAV